MQKKIIALAIASALTAPALALADTANVNFYGVLFADVESVKAGTAGSVAYPTTPAPNGVTSRGRVISDASRIGLNGSDDLGNGLTGIFQVETRVNLAGNELASGTVVGGGSGSTAGIFDGIRNSNLGLKGGFGTAFIGQWDTPFKVTHNKIELFDNTTIATSLALLGSVPLASGKGVNLFNVRQGSSIQYWTPDMSGFQVKAAYSTVNVPSADTANAWGTPNLMSVSGAYDAGPIYVALAYESHKAAPASATISALTDKGTRLVGAYTMDAFQVGLTYESITIAQTAPAADKKRTAYSLEGKYNLPAAGTIAATYTKAGNYGGVADTGATQISLRYGYMMSKRTELFGMYTNINNKAAANYNFADVPTIAAAVGSKVSGYGVGVRHTF